MGVNIMREFQTEQSILPSNLFSKVNCSSSTTAKDANMEPIAE